jgi:hypothetical protein
MKDQHNPNMSGLIFGIRGKQLPRNSEAAKFNTLEVLEVRLKSKAPANTNMIRGCCCFHCGNSCGLFRG